MSQVASASDRIVAVSSAAGLAAIGVVRLSGEGVHHSLSRLVKGDIGAPRRPSLHTLVDPDDGHPIDRALIWWAPGPATYTGEDMVEVHAHGNPVLLDAIVDACCRVGARPADPGEFTRRALLNGKLDLSGAEAILAAVEATSLAGARAAARVMDGDLQRDMDDIRERLVGVAARVEAVIDYPEDVGELVDGATADELDGLAVSLERAAREVSAAGRLMAGADVVLLGPVNAGKSTLLNRIVGQPRAIVDPEPGTTRDVVTAERELAGIRVRFHDTAGLRTGGTIESVEVEGIRRARAMRERATCVVFVLDATRPGVGVPRPGDLVVVNKSDLDESGATWCDGLPLSALTGQGVDSLLQLLEERLSVRDDGAGTLLWTERQGAAALRASGHLAGAARQLRTGEFGPVAIEIGDSLRALGELLGVDPEDAVLDELFARFCVGK